MTFAGAAFGQLEVDTEGLSLMINEVAELATHAEGWLSITEGFLMALPHVLMGPAKADDAEGLWLLGAKGVVGSQHRSLVQMGVGKRWGCGFWQTRISRLLAFGSTHGTRCSILCWTSKQGSSLEPQLEVDTIMG